MCYYRFSHCDRDFRFCEIEREIERYKETTTELEEQDLHLQVISTESPEIIYVALRNVMQKVSLYEEEDDP